jgi:hypothetical protein
MARRNPTPSKPDKPPKPDKPSRRTKMEQRATRDIRISQRPYMDQLQRSSVATENAYGGLADQLAPMGKQYGNQTEGIAGDLTSQLAALSAALGGDTPVAGGSMLPGTEMQAGSNMGTVLGAGALETLASQAQRNLGYQQSAVREGGLAERTALDNLTQQRLQAMQQRPELILQRLDELRQQRLENSLVKSQMAGDEAFSQYLQSMLGNLITPPKRGSRHRRRGGGGGDVGSTDANGNPNTPPTPPGDTTPEPNGSPRPRRGRK